MQLIAQHIPRAHLACSTFIPAGTLAAGGQLKGRCSGRDVPGITKKALGYDPIRTFESPRLSISRDYTGEAEK